MTEKKKKRKYTRKHLNWRLDYDYWHKLSDEEKEWLDKFNDEYYRNTFNELDSIHDLKAPYEYDVRYNRKRKGTVKQQLMYEEYIRRRDILYNFDKLTYNGSTIYNPDMYTQIASSSPEDDIIEVIDAKNKSKVSNKESDKKDN